MTRPFNQRVVCSNCGQKTTAESAFERWMRNLTVLDSVRDGLVRFDLDMLLHRYKLVPDKKSSRQIQALMFVEVKTHGAEPSAAQRDTLYMLNQVLRNRKPNMHSEPRRQAAKQPTRVYSTLNQKDVTLRMFGGHLLQFEKDSPDNSAWMKWDKTYPIGIPELLGLMRFDLDPDNPTKEYDWRRRSEPFANIPTLFDA